MASRGPGQRAGLTREAILAAARSLLAAGGLESLTMRAIADDLGVAPNALYSHVANKSALVDDLLDDVLAEVAEPSVDEPSTGLRQVMASTYEVLLAHADLVPVYLARQGARGPNAQRLGAIMDDLLVKAGLAGASVGEARRVLIVYTIGLAAFSAQIPIGPGEDPPVRPDEARDQFARGLDWLLAGITQSQ
jgi:TetR/AcrR family tetracycline transcriptional repressor